MRRHTVVGAHRGSLLVSGRLPGRTGGRPRISLGLGIAKRSDVLSEAQTQHWISVFAPGFSGSDFEAARNDACPSDDTVCRTRICGRAVDTRKRVACLSRMPLTYRSPPSHIAHQEARARGQQCQVCHSDGWLPLAGWPPNPPPPSPVPHPRPLAPPPPPQHGAPPSPLTASGPRHPTTKAQARTSPMFLRGWPPNGSKCGPP